MPEDKGQEAEPPLPDPGPPFRVGDEVAFFPAVLGPPSMWLRLDYALIDEIDEEAESFGFHFMSLPSVRHAQDMANIVRRGPEYARWRQAFDQAMTETQDEEIAAARTRGLWKRVMAEHPIHGHDLDRSE